MKNITTSDEPMSVTEYHYNHKVVVLPFNITKHRHHNGTIINPKPDFGQTWYDFLGNKYLCISDGMFVDEFGVIKTQFNIDTDLFFAPLVVAVEVQPLRVSDNAAKGGRATGLDNMAL